MSLSKEGNVVANGSIQNNGNGEAAAGHVHVFGWYGTAWARTLMERQ